MPPRLAPETSPPFFAAVGYSRLITGAMNSIWVAIVVALVILIAFMVWDRSQGRKTLLNYLMHDKYTVGMGGAVATAPPGGPTAAGVGRCGNLGSDNCPYVGSD